MSSASQFQANLFQPSVWDEIPMKRDNKSMSVVIDPDYELGLDDYNTPVRLPNNFKFVTLSQHTPKDISMITLFLNEHYIPSKVSKNIYRYTSKFVEYKLCSPSGHFKNRDTIILAIVKQHTNNIYGLVVAIPILYYIDGNYINSYTIEWLATHTKFRGRKIAIVLQKELYRRLYNTGYSIGLLFSAPLILPFQSTTSPSRLLYKQLKYTQSEYDKSQIEKLKTARAKIKDVQKIKEINRLIDELTPPQIQPTSVIHQIRLANKSDMASLYEIYYQRCQSKFRIYRLYNQKEFEYTFTPIKDMIYTYVMTNSDGIIKDFITIYNLDNPDGMSKSAYLYYVTYPGKSEILKLFLQNVMYVLAQSGYETLYSHEYLDVSEVLLKHLDFTYINEHDKGIGFYTFNYNTKVISTSESGLGIHI